MLLKIEASGMCGSDLHAYRAPSGSETGMPIDHEPCGVVEELGPNVDAQKTPVGMRAIQHHYRGCGSCDQCSGGWTQLCRNGYIGYGYDAPGSHAQYMAVPASTLVPLPDSITFTAGAAMAWNTDKYGKPGSSGAPSSWADFWDVKKFPGTRAYRANNVDGALEPALMADGVPPEKVYDVLSTRAGMKRAINKIRDLKPHITVFW